MLPGNDMLDVVRQVAVLLPEQAILTTIGRSTPDKVPVATSIASERANPVVAEP